MQVPVTLTAEEYANVKAVAEAWTANKPAEGDGEYWWPGKVLSAFLRAAPGSPVSSVGEANGRAIEEPEGAQGKDA
jgi:hypothetical protein